MFHQVEGLVVQDKGEVSFANLKYILSDFLQYMLEMLRLDLDQVSSHLPNLVLRWISPVYSVGGDGCKSLLPYRVG